MGCDIHLVLERRRSAKGEREWTGVMSSDIMPGGRPPVARRDYAFFAEVASVRGQSKSGSYPENIPEDVSTLAWQEYMRAPTDHHHASHLALGRFCELYLSVNPDAGRKEFAAHDLFGIDPEYPEGCEYRVVFWFDN